MGPFTIERLTATREEVLLRSVNTCVVGQWPIF